MEKANCDLTDYLKVRRTTQQKILLFQSILDGMQQLYEIQIYHRDIKNDNIFIFGDECNIGDLGLMRFKDEDYLSIDNFQRIGAFGWECPEAMNFFLVNELLKILNLHLMIKLMRHLTFFNLANYFGIYYKVTYQ